MYFPYQQNMPLLAVENQRQVKYQVKLFLELIISNKKKAIPPRFRGGFFYR